MTGQAAWFDVRVRISPAAADEPEVTAPQFKALTPLPGQVGSDESWIAYFAGGRRRD